MFNKNKFFIIVILILLGIVIFGLSYYSNKVHNLEYELKQIELKPDTTRTKPKLDSKTSAKVSDKDGVLVPKVIYRDTGSVKTIIKYDTITLIDTLKVLEDFYSLNYFKDSVFIQDVDIKVLDIIQKNRIFARDYIITNTRNEESFKRNALYAGGMGGGNSNSFLFGPSLHYADKRNNMFGGMYMINSGGNNTFLFSYSKKITFKK